jgi:hypothetical protein
MTEQGKRLGLSIKGWGVFRKSDGKLMWWYDGVHGERMQFEIFKRRYDAVSAKAEWLNGGGESCEVKKVEIREVKP